METLCKRAIKGEGARAGVKILFRPRSLRAKEKGKGEGKQLGTRILLWKRERVSGKKEGNQDYGAIELSHRLGGHPGPKVRKRNGGERLRENRGTGGGVGGSSLVRGKRKGAAAKVGRNA